VTAQVEVRRADVPDAVRVVHTLCAAFQDDPVSGWLIPDVQERRRRHPGFFGAFVDHTIVWGEVHTSTDYAGVALWLEVDPRDGILLGAAEELFGDALGPHLARFQMLDALIAAAHPGGVRHAYLPYIAVHPHKQGRGVGCALLAYALARLDRAGLPAYLEASTPRSSRLYQRLGFTARPAPLSLPHGPTPRPMWRDPRPAMADDARDDGGRREVHYDGDGPGYAGLVNRHGVTANGRWRDPHRGAPQPARWPLAATGGLGDRFGALLDRHLDAVADPFRLIDVMRWLNRTPPW
jgi:ribosomal protein S18 acetylase RimI-like enzyme